MAREISNSDDYIDSRDVEARIEELEEMESKTVWLFNYNLPGYMPDNDPEEYEEWEEAFEALADMLENLAEEEEEESPDLASEYQNARGTLLLDASKMDGREVGVLAGRYFFSIEEGMSEGLDEYDQEELDNLRKLRDQANYGDWSYGETLIRESAFTDYVQELCEDCGYISKDFPHWIEIDWEATAENVAQDYTTVDFDGVDYYVRS